LASPFLIKRRAGWYFRIRVPTDLIPVFGTHLTRSLATRDHSVARQRAVATAARVLEHWEEVRRTMSAKWRGKEIGELLTEDMIGADRGELDKFEAGLTPEDRARFRGRLALLVRAEQKDVIEYQADVAALAGMVHELHVNRLKGEIEGLKGAISVLSNAGAAAGRALGAAAEPFEKPAPDRHAPDPRSRHSWTDFTKSFFTDRPSIGTSSAQSHGQAFRALEGIISKKPIGDVTKADIKEFADHLRDKVINRAGRTRMSRETIKKMLSHVRSFFEWATEAGIIQVNPADGVRPRSATREERDLEGARQAFTKEQLERLFHSPIYTGCEGQNRRNAPGSVILRDERYWFFLVALFTGARVEELGEVPAKLADLEGIACLDLRDVGTKTNNSPRLIPVLPGLKRLGFMDWAKTKEAHGKLFQGGSSFTDWSKGSNRYLREIGITDPTIVTYSLRHNFRQMLNSSKLLGLSLETGDKIFGHGTKGGRTVGAGYGRALSVDEARLFIDTVKAPIDLSHLHPILLS
jgi:integrase